MTPIDTDPNWRWFNDNRCGVLRKEHFTYTVWYREGGEVWAAAITLMRHRSMTTDIATGLGQTWQEAIKATQKYARDEFLLLSKEV